MLFAIFPRTKALFRSLYSHKSAKFALAARIRGKLLGLTRILR
jgi:hypothetical protein